MFIRHMEKPYFIALKLDIETFLLLLIDLRHFKDNFSHKPTSSRSAHVYYKREKMCLFCFKYYHSHFFLPVQSVVYLHRTLIVLFMLHAVASFPFFNGCVYLQKLGSLCVEMILIIEKQFSKPLVHISSHTLDSLSAI